MARGQSLVEYLLTMAFLVGGIAAALASPHTTAWMETLYRAVVQTVAPAHVPDPEGR
ncbi:MAG: hypothetical protein HYV02_04465 [Deltaproteobacteria bacterium]|nr:hypothetical protein [Deltaproteobacteria bacterium]